MDLGLRSSWIIQVSLVREKAARGWRQPGGGGGAKDGQHWQSQTRAQSAVPTASAGASPAHTLAGALASRAGKG